MAPVSHVNTLNYCFVFLFQPCHYPICFSPFPPSLRGQTQPCRCLDLWPLTFTHVHKNAHLHTQPQAYDWLMSLRLATHLCREHSSQCWVCMRHREGVCVGEREGLHWFDKQRKTRRLWWPLAFCVCVYGHDNDWVMSCVCDSFPLLCNIMPLCACCESGVHFIKTINEHCLKSI